MSSEGGPTAGAGADKDDATASEPPAAVPPGPSSTASGAAQEAADGTTVTSAPVVKEVAPDGETSQAETKLSEETEKPEHLAKSSSAASAAPAAVSAVAAAAPPPPPSDTPTKELATVHADESKEVSDSNLPTNNESKNEKTTQSAMDVETPTLESVKEVMSTAEEVSEPIMDDPSGKPTALENEPTQEGLGDDAMEIDDTTPDKTAEEQKIPEDKTEVVVAASAPTPVDATTETTSPAAAEPTTDDATTETSPAMAEPTQNTTAKTSPTMAEPTQNQSSAEDDLKDMFEQLVPRARRPKKKKVCTKAIKLSIPSSTAGSRSKKEIKNSNTARNNISASITPTPQLPQTNTFTSAERLLMPDEEYWGIDLRDERDKALTFFEETHEEQDPAFLDYIKKKKENALKEKLAELDARDKEGRQGIENVINQLSKEKRESTDKSHMIYRQKIDEDEKKDMVLLQKTFQERTQMEQSKIEKSLKYVQAKQQKEVTMALQHHQAQQQQQQIPEQHAQLQWQKTIQTFQAKHQHQMQDLSRKGQEIRAKTTNDYKREQEKIKKKYQKKRAEVDGRKEKIVSQQMGQFAQLKQRHLKRHLQKMMLEREEVMIASEDSDGSKKASTNKTPEKEPEGVTEKEEHRPPSPIKSVPDWVKKAEPELRDSIARQKHRKGVLSQTVRQLSIEIHNEGIWTLVVRKSEEEGKGETFDQEFIGWGPRAFMTLESIVCGEIPPYYESLTFGESPVTQGGQLRCAIIDLRTSEETATTDRAIAFREQEMSRLKELEASTAELAKVALEAEKAFKKAEMEQRQASAEAENAAKIQEKARQDLDTFTSKFRSFLGPDLNPLPTTNAKHRQELVQTIMRYKSNIQIAGTKAAQAHKNMTEAKNRAQRLHHTLKAAQKNVASNSSLSKKKKALPGSMTPPRQLTEEEKSTRVTDIVKCLATVASKRREQLNQKKNSTFSKTWTASFPDLSDSMKKSLWHRMVRRKQQVVLRPSSESLINDLRKTLGGPNKSPGGRTAAQIEEEIEKEMLKAEEIFLLACHPAPDEQLPSVPSPSNWAEPGWMLDLSVPDESSPETILPCAPTFPVLNKALRDFASAPGRQAASLLNPSSFRCLTSPMTPFSKASSLAEVDLSLFSSTSRVEGDPLEISDKDIQRGYIFSLKPLQLKSPAPSKRKSSSKDDNSENQTAGSTAKSCDSSLESASERSQKRRRIAKDQESTPRKKKKPESTAAGSSGKNTDIPATQPNPRSRKKPATSPAKQVVAAIQPAQAIHQQQTLPNQQHVPQLPPQGSQQNKQHQAPQQKHVRQRQNNNPSNLSNQQQAPRASGQNQRQNHPIPQQQSQPNQRQNQQQQNPQQQHNPQQQPQTIRQRQSLNPSNIPSPHQQMAQNNQQAQSIHQRQSNNSSNMPNQHQQQMVQNNQQPQQHHMSAQHQQHLQQMAQFRMSGMHPGFQPTPQMMQQFYAHQAQRFPAGLSPMQMQRAGVSMPFFPGPSPQNSPNAVGPNAGQQLSQQNNQQPQHSQHGQHPQQQGQQRGQEPKDQNDPLFMLK